MESPIAQLRSLFLLLIFWGTALPVSAENPSCHIEAFVVQVPDMGCPMERYPVVFKPAQPHLTFAQSLRVELLSSSFSFEVKQGGTPHRFNLKPGTYRFKITNTSNPYCSTIQDLNVQRNTRHRPLIAVCKDTSVQLQEGGVYLRPRNLAAASHSPCNPIKFESDKHFFSTADIGVNKVKVSLVDAEKRKQSCYSTVNVLPLPSSPNSSPIVRFEQCAASPSDIDNTISESGYITMRSKGLAAGKFANLLSQARYGDGEIMVKLTNLEGDDQASGKAGLIIAEHCHSSSSFISLALEANTGTLHKEFRLNTGGEVVKEWEHRLHPPKWLKLKRKGSHFKAFTSHNGLHWQLVYSTSMQLAAVLQWGLIVEKGSSDGSTIATFNHLRISSEANLSFPLSNQQPITIIENKTVLPDAYSTPKSETIMEQEQWSIFPNPAQDYLEVTLPIWKDDRATLHLLNSAGKAVLEEQLDVLNGQSHWMNLARVARGVYYLKLQTIQGQHLTKKVIVDK